MRRKKGHGQLQCAQTQVNLLGWASDGACCVLRCVVYLFGRRILPTTEKSSDSDQRAFWLIV